MALQYQIAQPIQHLRQLNVCMIGYTPCMLNKLHMANEQAKRSKRTEANCIPAHRNGSGIVVCWGHPVHILLLFPRLLMMLML